LRDKMPLMTVALLCENRFLGEAATEPFSGRNRTVIPEVGAWPIVPLCKNAEATPSDDGTASTAQLG
jgi:hypothetical protein